MNALVLRLLINHLADIISSLEEQMDAACQQPSIIAFTKIQKSPLSESYTYKELLPLYGLMQTLDKSLLGIGVDETE